MEFTVSGKELQAYLAIADNTIKKGEGAGHSGYIKFEASPGLGLRCVVDDSGVSVDGLLAAEVQQSGSLLIEGDVLGDIVKVKYDEIIRFRVEGRNIVINAGKSEYNIGYASSKDFPVKRGPGEMDYIEFDGSILHDAVKRAVRSVGDKFNDWRDGVTVEFRSDHIKAFSSDSHRMFEYRAPADLPFEETICIPKRQCQEIINLESFNKMAFTNGAIWLKSDTITMSLALMDATTPWIGFDRIESEASEFTATVNAARLRTVIRNISAIAKKGSDTFRAELSFAPSVLMLSINSKEAGQSFDALKCDFNGHGFKYALNRIYLIDALEQLSCEEVTFIIPGNPVMPLMLKRAAVDGQESSISVKTCILGYTQA